MIRNETVHTDPDAPTGTLPRRRRRQYFNRRTAALAALITCALGFYAGVRVEKGQLSGSGTASLGATPARAAGGRAGGRAGLAALFGGSGQPSPGAGGAGGGASFGTVASVSGKTLDLTEASGNTVKVKLTSATKISKTQSVSRGAIHPGDTVVIQGVSGSGSTLSAASVTDSGNRSSGSSAGGGSGSAGGGSAGSGAGAAVKSLF